ncbi:RING finger protein 145 [Daphnia magna]|uniref:RING finger protein 145 n=1 Tax=Daphnia magna TaxID=35525 RepID=A0A164QJE8_9CRUS|nr:RING finger protein 145 [Daphnia magna]
MFSTSNWPAIDLTFKGEHFENFASVVLRVPGLMLIDQWSHISSDRLWPQTAEVMDKCYAFIFHLMLIHGLVILIVPLPKLVTIYMHYLSLAALTGASLLSRHFVLIELQDLDKDATFPKSTGVSMTPPTTQLPSVINFSPEYALKFAREFRPPGISSEVPAYQFAERTLIGIGLIVDSMEMDLECFSLLHQLAVLSVQLFIVSCVNFFLDVESNIKRAFLAIYCLPIVIRLSGFAQSDLLLVHNFATAAIILAAIYYVLSCVPAILGELKFLYLYAAHEIEALSLPHLAMDICSRLFVPSQFFVFWLGHCINQLHALLIHPDLVANSGVYSDEWYMVFLCAISQICDSPLTLASTCVAMSYASSIGQAGIKIFILNYQAYAAEQNPHAGLTEGLTMALLAAQTGLIRIKMPQRLAIFSIILFVVVASLIQSVYETTEPMLLALSANKDRHIMRHVRILLLCVFLFAFPLYMTFILCYIFDLNFWTLVVISTCVMTSVQVVGLLVIYYTRAVVRCLEFMVALFVVCAGFHESLVGQWSWSNSVVLVVHCYFNVWQRLQTGWISFLRRREAVKHINALPSASQEQLAVHNDVCAICYQTMNLVGTVRVTRCKHFFHGNCLRKWLYVQEKCPMCSAAITLTQAEESSADAAEAPLSEANKTSSQDRKVHFSFAENQSSGNSESNDVAEETEDGASPSQNIAAASPSGTFPQNQNFDTLLHAAQQDVRQAKLRGAQARHSRSKSESVARILE